MHDIESTNVPQRYQHVGKPPHLKTLFVTKTQDEGTYTPAKATAGLESRWCSFSLFNSVMFRLVLDFRLGVWLASISKFFWVSLKM